MGRVPVDQQNKHLLAKNKKLTIKVVKLQKTVELFAADLKAKFEKYGDVEKVLAERDSYTTNMRNMRQQVSEMDSDRRDAIRRKDEMCRQANQSKTRQKEAEDKAKRAEDKAKRAEEMRETVLGQNKKIKNESDKVKQENEMLRTKMTRLNEFKGFERLVKVQNDLAQIFRDDNLILEEIRNICSLIDPENVEKERKKMRKKSEEEVLDLAKQWNYTCPITLEIMDHPVIAEDGMTYEKSAIQDYFNSAHYQNNTRSPMTKQNMGRSLLPNCSMKSQISMWRDGLKKCGMDYF